MLYQLMSATGFVFWGVVIALFLLNALCLGNDKNISALGFTFLALVVAVMFTDLFAGASLLWLIVLFAAYLAIGVAWAVWKWRALVIEKLHTARLKYNEYAAPKPNEPGAVAKSFSEWSEDNYHYRRPDAASHSDKITAWIALWPWSMSWLALRFPWRLCVILYERLSTVFERMSQKLWAD